MKSGWIKIYRSIQESCSRRGYGADTLGVMVWLLVSANYAPTENPHGGTIQPGELIINMHKSARELDVSFWRFYAIIQKLSEDGFISVKTATRAGVKIAIKKFMDYQGNSTNNKTNNYPFTESTTYEDSTNNNANNSKKNTKNANNSTNNKTNNYPSTESTTYEDSTNNNANNSTNNNGASLKEINKEININTDIVPEVLPPQNTPGPASEFVLESEPSKPKKPEITFDYDHGCQFGGSGLEAAKQLWSEAYPGLDIEGQLQQARAWLFANSSPAKRKKDIKAFLCRWMKKAQEIQDKRDAWKGASGKAKSISEKQKEWATGKFTGDYGAPEKDDEYLNLLTTTTTTTNQGA